MITHVAIKDSNGHVWRLPPPNRHGHVIHSIYVHLGETAKNGTKARKLLSGSIQGFTNEDGTFLTRLEAWHEAKRCSQLLPPYNPANPKERRGKVTEEPAELFSEDLW